MIMILYVSFIFFILINLVQCQTQTPCPDVFRYEENTKENDRWYGVVQLRTSEDLTGVWLHVILDRQADLLGNWFGEATSSDNTEFTVRNSKYKLEAGPPVSVRFFVKYNPAHAIPSIKSIRLNGKTICTSENGGNDMRATTPTLHISQSRPTQASATTTSKNNNNHQSRPATLNTAGNSRPSNNGNNNNGRPSSPTSSSNNVGRPVNTRPTERHTERTTDRSSPNRGTTESYYPNSGNSYNNRPSSSSSAIIYEDNDSDDEFFPGDFANLNAQNRPASRPAQESSRTPGCGVVSSRPSPLIANGQDTTPGQWPWHAALYHSKGIQLMYTCGATLISDRHILTAAHCVTKQRSNRPVNPTNILVYLGKYNLITFGPEVQDRDVSEIYVHPEYNYTVYFNDVAVLKLSRPVELTNFVRPCCLWDEETDLEDVIGRQGVVVGWGFDERKKLSNKLMQAAMPIVSTVKCIYSNRDFFSRFTFEKNYCAGFKNGTSVCNGDSGGGMVFPKKGSNGQSTVWQIRGLVSVGVALQGEGICDTSQYIVFTDVAKHTHWIRQVLSD